ncbi:hypothetical protein CCP3SC1AL1_110020 [Gammaproteobacteria bacterium]
MTDEMFKANARLISATPELYAALKVIQLDKAVRAVVATVSPMTLEQVEDAIRKAEALVK